jgi:4-carboxymuconolactone decarboxylase
MARLAKLSPGLFDEEQKRLYETITAGPRADGRQSFQLVDGAGALARSGDLDDDQYADAVAQLGTAALFELTILVGYYATLALQLRVFRVGAPDR